MRDYLLSLASIVALVGVHGCGGPGDSRFGDPQGDAGAGGGTGGGGFGVLGGEGGIAGGNPGGGVTNACAADHAEAGIAPSYLVFVMDRSDSMAQDSKWPSCSAALTTFFANSQTSGLSASLTFLPEVQAGTQSTSNSPTFLCTSSSYATADVPMTALPSSTFVTTIQGQMLQYGTPTLAALEGAGMQAQATLQQHAGAKVAIVLATDGVPYGCTGNTVQTVSAAAQSLAQSGILTYVIGVGPATGNLDAIAKGGGTTQAFVVPTSNPQQTEQAFLGAVQTVQGSLGCDYGIPAPPNGDKINFQQVNVVYTPPTPPGAQGMTLDYSADCSNPDGWRYDNPAAPSKIELCTLACGMAEKDAGAKVDIVFGCATSGLPTH